MPISHSQNAVSLDPISYISCLSRVNRDTAIARGGVLRFMNRHLDPVEIVRANYGFSQTEVYEPGVHEGHKKATWTHDNVDGSKYVKDCIHYFAFKVGTVPSYLGGKDLTCKLRKRVYQQAAELLSLTCISSVQPVHWRETSLLDSNCT